MYSLQDPWTVGSAVLLVASWAFVLVRSYCG